MKCPRVTVLMSVHNGGGWLRPAIDSILAQTWRDFEFLIIDDSSTDDSAEQVRAVTDPRIRLVCLPVNVGLTRSLNVGLKEARGDLIARQDADDLSGPERLALQIRFLDQHPEVAVVGAQGWTINENGGSRRCRDVPLTAAAVRWLSLLDNPVIHTSAVFRTGVVREEFDGYDESFTTCQDYDLWTRVMARYEVCNLAERLVTVREHGRSVSATRRGEAAEPIRRVLRGIASRHGFALSSDEEALLLGFRRHLEATEVTAVKGLMTRWRRYLQADCGDIRRTEARVTARIGYNLLTTDRSAAFRELIAAIQLDPSVGSTLPWVRVLGLAMLGEKAKAFSR